VKQARLLARYGISTDDLSFGDAGRYIADIEANGWRRPRRWSWQPTDDELEAHFGDPGAFHRQMETSQ
jgi:hypothetical protein